MRLGSPSSFECNMNSTFVGGSRIPHRWLVGFGRDLAQEPTTPLSIVDRRVGSTFRQRVHFKYHPPPFGDIRHRTKYTGTFGKLSWSLPPTAIRTRDQCRTTSHVVLARPLTPPHEYLVPVTESFRGL